MLGLRFCARAFSSCGKRGPLFIAVCGPLTIVIACFLICSGCDVNSPRQPGANGEGEEEARDGQTPLHLAASWGLQETIQCLLEFGAPVTAQDAEGRVPVHVAVSNQHGVIIQLLISHPDIHLHVRDRQGLTPFACAVTYKNNKAARPS